MNISATENTEKKYNSEAEINKIIEKWFEETAIQFEDKVKTAKKIDILLGCSFIAARNYCKAVFLLLGTEHKMPAKALLRILCELLVKIIWCLNIPANFKDDRDNIVTQNINSWIKTTLKKNAKIIERLKEATTNEKSTKLDNMLKTILDNADRIKEKEMPNFTEIFKSLPEPWTKQRGLLYLRFNNAVHLDTKSLGGLIKCDVDDYHYIHDSKEDINELIEYGFIYAYNFNLLVRSYYNWDFKQMDEEYKVILEKINKT